MFASEIFRQEEGAHTVSCLNRSCVAVALGTDWMSCDVARFSPILSVSIFYFFLVKTFC